MSGPRTKRQFAGAASDPSQRQITSFFKTTSSTSTSDGARGASKQSTSRGPALPPQVQTDLLTVGMRVRKAVPEGYKTGSEYGAFTLWAENHNGSATNPSRPASSVRSTTTYYSPAMRELEPFCGINKVGGLAFQPAYTAHPRTDQASSDAMPDLTSSQDTVSSNGSFRSPSFSPATLPLNITTTAAGGPVSLPTRKRFFTSEEDEDDDPASNPLQHAGPFRLSSDNSPPTRWLDEEISPRSLAPPPGVWENARVLAVPRRPRHLRKGGEAEAEAEEQENVMNIMAVVQGSQGVVDGGGSDFEEASFLDYGGLMADGRMDVE